MYGNILCNLSHSRTHSSNSYLQSRVQGAYQKHINTLLIRNDMKQKPYLERLCCLIRSCKE